MVTVTYHTVIIVFLVLGLIFGIIGAALGKYGNVNEPLVAANLAFLIIGLICLAIALILEILFKCVDKVKNSGAALIVEIVVLIIAAISFIISAAIITNSLTIVLGMVTCACVFSCQGLFLFLIQWKCSA